MANVFASEAQGQPVLVAGRPMVQICVIGREDLCAAILAHGCRFRETDIMVGEDSHNQRSSSGEMCLYAHIRILVLDIFNTNIDGGEEVSVVRFSYTPPPHVTLCHAIQDGWTIFETTRRTDELEETLDPWIPRLAGEWWPPQDFEFLLGSPTCLSIKVTSVLHTWIRQIVQEMQDALGEARCFPRRYGHHIRFDRHVYRVFAAV